MTEIEQKKAAKEFAEYWKNRGYEKGESQSFWLSLLGNVFGIEHPEKFIKFENQVHIDHTSFIDGTIPVTHVLIEQKSIDKDLRKAIRQSDGTYLNPFQQAKRYSAELPYSERPRWIITCNFKEFLIYDMEKPTGEPDSVLLNDLPDELYRLKFIVDTGSELLKKEMEISLKAGEIVGELYNEILAQYENPNDENSLRSLNMLCVRLVFCLYAEDSGLFGERLKFHNYLKAVADKDITDVREALIKLFNVLNTVPEKRDKYMKADLASFPYVNGGLFAEENIEIPQFNEKIVKLLLKNASEDFDWSNISPTIFGAVFESTLNPETRRSGGMHYTSIENIHKVIDPLFLDDLNAEMQEIKSIQVYRTRNRRLEEFRNKLSSLNFFDPACGSGNFLTETYLSLRRLENEALQLQRGGQITFLDDIIKVTISQFYGIEINDFAVTVAKTALWIAESQMLRETEDIVQITLDFLPLKSYANITEGNALRLNWEEVVPKNKLNYIMGNPPFVGQQLRSKSQSEDMAIVFGKGTSETKLDYVLCWYKKSLDLINSVQNNKIKVAFVSTNSICQGESVPTFWNRMFEDDIDLGFAYKTFKWNNESSTSASVHCVIIGFSNKPYIGNKYIFDDTKKTKVEHINAYLQNAPDVWITSRINVPPKDMPKMIKGSEPCDGGKLFLTASEKSEFENNYPSLARYIKPFVGGDEYLKNKFGVFTRFCLWFKNGRIEDYAHIREIKSRLSFIADKRRASSADRIRVKANYPYLFCQIRQPDSNYLIFPQHSSGDRKYIPIGFMDKDVIVGNACYIIPQASLYLFGILISNVHNAWMRLVCGRIGTGYRYSPAIYNNFPFPEINYQQKAKIEQTAQAILDARALYPNNTLADLYDENTMPPELRKAHQHNDKAVMQEYGFWGKLNTESECVAELMKMYNKLNKSL